jgi:flagellar biosynthesis protein FlhF
MAPSSSLAELLSLLLGADLDGEIAHSVVDAVYQASAGDPAAALDAVRGELTRRIRTNSDLGARSAGQRVIALAGSPGAGKTTTLVKLAIRYGLTARRSLHLISTDDYRVGGADQLRSYASILGASFQIAGTASALAQALEEHRSKDLILIDTPGLTVSDLEPGNDLIRFIAGRPGIEAHLVLMSSMRPADLYRVWNVFGAYKFARLIFTRTDETSALGGPFSLAARSGTPISFLSTGQGIPEDLECADASRIVDRILPRDPQWRATAAA